MLRKIYNKKNFIEKDLKYNSLLVSLLINKILKHGKKHIAQNIVYNSFNYIKMFLKINPLKVFQKALNNLYIKFKLTKKVISGTTIKVPVLIKPYGSLNFALRLLIKNAKERIEKQMFLKLANEIIDSSKKIGNSIKKKEELLKLIETNKVFL